MSEEEKFEEIIRRKFDEKKFAFNEENWEKAERKIDSARSKSKIFKWAAVFTIGLFTGMVLMLPFIKIKNAEKAIEFTDIIRTPNSENKGSEFKKETGKKPFKENGHAITPPEIKTENQSRLSRDENEIFNSTEKPKTQTNSGDLVTRSEDRGMDKLNYSNPVVRGKETAEVNPNKNSVNEQKKILQLEQQSKRSDQGKKKDEGVQPEKAQLFAVNKAKTNKASAQTEDSINKDSEKKNQQENNSEQATGSTKTETSADKTVAKKDTLIETTSLTDSATTLNQKEEEAIAAKDSVQSKTDSSSITSQNKPAVAASLGGLASMNIISLEAGTNFVLGWKYNDTLEGRGFNPLFGISYTHCFNPTWSLSLGIQYGSIGNLKVSQKIFSYKTFDFGHTWVDTVVDTKRIYYAVLPVQLYCNFNNKNSIGLGGSFSYLLNTTSNVSIYKPTYIVSDGKEDPTQEKKELGYYAGAFKMWDASLSILYRRKISQKFSVSVLANYGLFDIKSDVFFSREKIERSSGLKMIITYDLFQY